jgi:hypothetical protein
MTNAEKKLIRDRLKKYLEILYIFLNGIGVIKDKEAELREEVDKTLKALSLL